jgi:hypothetical protein
MTIATIDVVAGDNLPVVTLSLADKSNGMPIDVSDSTVTVYFREIGALAGSDGAPAGTPLTCTNLNTGTDGQVTFYFQGDVTNVPAGLYEGSIVIVKPGPLRHTVYDTLRFRVRPA